MSFQGPSQTQPVITQPDAEEAKKPQQGRKRKPSPIWKNKRMPSILSGAREHNEELEKLNSKLPAKPTTTNELISDKPTPVASSDSLKKTSPDVSSLLCEETLDLPAALGSVISELDRDAQESIRCEGSFAAGAASQVKPAAILSPYSKAIKDAHSKGVGAPLANRNDYKANYTLEEFYDRIDACVTANQQWKKVKLR